MPEWRGLAQEITDKGEAILVLDDFTDHPDIHQAASGGEHVDNTAVGSRQATNKKSVGGLEWKARCCPEGPIAPHTLDQVEQQMKVQSFKSET